MAVDVGIAVKGTGAAPSIVTASGTSQVSGSTFYVFCIFDSFTSFTSVSDSKGNTYTQVGTELTPNGARVRLYKCVNGTGGSSHTATVAIGAGGAVATVWLIEVTGAATSNPVDQSDSRVDAASPFTLAAGLTTTQAKELLLSFMAGDGSGATVTNAEGGLGSSTVVSQEQNGLSNWCGGVAKSYKTSTGTFNPSWTSTNATSVAVFLETIKEAAAAGSKTGTGAATSPKPTVAGTAVRHSRGSGAITSSKATLSGTATKNGAVSNKTGTGALTSSKATSAGTAHRGVQDLGGTVALTSSKATLSGTGTVSNHEGVVGSGFLTSSKATLSGSGTTHKRWAGTGALTGPRATASGTTRLGHRGTGALTSPKPVILGAGAGVSGNPVDYPRIGHKSGRNRSVRSAHGRTFKHG